LLWVFLGECQAIGVLICIVFDSVLANSRKMVESVKKIRGPVEVRLGIGDGVAEAAHCLERTTDLIRKRTNDGFRRGILAAPVASPA
jgi:RecB family endonuclease NucS